MAIISVACIETGSGMTEESDEKHVSLSDDENETETRKRLEALEKRIGLAKKRQQDQNKPAKHVQFGGSEKIGRALRLPVEFGSGVLVGMGLGWLVDHFLGSSPWGMVVFVIIGFCAGLLNLLRATGHIKANRFDGKNQPSQKEK